ncbi:97 kDa heat shock protein like [Argiope bruennichi]|uniref:97 kDa heat shock protein like n=1 Tax=Argiope bruennichi TaxID=94029 RepID=A0A8T0EEJ7_ARGBR|nr:97 kDa heat shock protein like [Argiope bruennichi]
MAVVGFDIGNETCFIAVAKSGGIEVIDNEYSLRVTPSYIGFSEKSRDVGVTAKTKLVPNINNTVFGFKTFLGKKYDATLRDISFLPYNVIELQNGEFGVKVKYLHEEVLFSTQQIMAMLITKLKNITESKLGAKIRECVISVPLYYTDSQRRAMLDSAEIAGLKVLKLINEPTAIALSYGFYRQHLFNEPKIVVFVDLGQSSLTVTACAFTKDKLRVLGSVWNVNVGGRDFDGVLVKYFVEEFKARYQLDVLSNKKATMLLLLECEALKKQMSMNSRELELNIECFMNDMDVKGKMKRELFEKLASQLFLNIETTMEDLLTQTGLNKEAIHEIQIVGGSCRIPALKNIIHRVFGQYPQSTLNQDEAVARGCALQCAFLSPTLKTRDFVIEDIQPYAIHAMCHRSNIEDRVEVFPRFHKVPATKMVTYFYKMPFYLEIFYPDPVSSCCNDIGKYTFAGVPVEANTDSDVRIRIKMAVDMHGIFNVTSATLIIKEKTSNTKQLVLVDASRHAESNLECDDKQMQKGLPEEQLETEKESEDTAKYYDLTIEKDVRSLSRDQLYIFMQKEQEMINVDFHEKRMADLRNVVEEYVYYARDKLSSELRDYLTEVEWNNFLALLNNTEEWLYDCEDCQEAEYSRRLNEMKENIEPILNWHSQLEEAKSALHEFQKLLESFASIMRTLPQEKHPRMGNEDMKVLEDLWKSGNEFFGHWLHKVNEVKKYGDLPITAKDILAEMNGYKEKIQNVINKPDQEEFIVCANSSEDQNRTPGEAGEDLTTNQEFKEEYKSSSEKNSPGGQSTNESSLAR